MSNESFAHHYERYSTTLMLESDVKNIKKINNIIFKYFKTGKQSYIYEVINILKCLKNYINIYEAKKDILEHIDDDYKHIVDFVICNISVIDLDLLREHNVIPS